MVNIEAYAEGEPGDPAQSGDMIRKWVFGQDGQQAVSSMVKCLGFALRGEQWNNVSFSPHSVVCPLYNLTRCLPLGDVQLDADRVVSYLTQLIRECQRFSHWKHNMDVAIKILEYLAITPVRVCARARACAGVACALQFVYCP